MTDLQFNQLNDTQKKMVAIAFLLDHPTQRPEGSGRFFDKIEKYESSANETNNAIRQAQKSIQELKQQLDQIVGSINAVSMLVAEELPEEKLKEWCMAFDLDENGQPAIKKQKPVGPPDIAGHTARNQKPLIVK